MVGGLGAGGETDRRRPERLGHLGQEAGQLVVALDGDRRAVEGRDRPLRVGEGDERVERPDLRAGGHGRFEDLGAERPAGVDHRLAAVQPERLRQRRDRVVRHGEDDQLDLLDEGLRLGNPRAPSTAARNRSRRAGSRLATAWTGQPARVRATPRAVPTAPPPTIPMSGGSPAALC